MRSVASPLPRSTPTRQGWLFWVALALVASIGVFVAPLWFPPKTPAYSASYTVGFNNRVAALAAMMLSFVTLVFQLRKPTSSLINPTVQHQRTMPRSWAYIASLTVTSYVAVLGGLALQTGSFESDAAYFLTQLAQWSHFHLKLYRDLEFGYGPLLFAWPALVQHSLGRLGVSPEAAYLVALAVVQVLGLCLTFAFINGLPLRRSTKGWLLVALTIGTMRPSLGLNYTLFRFITPLAALASISRRAGQSKQAILLTVAQPLMLAISPEIGVSFVVGICFYAGYRAYEQRLSWFATPIFPLLSGLVFCVSVNGGYFYTMRQFSTGMLNEVVMPTPETLALLVAAIALAPLAVAAAIRRNQPYAALIVAIYGASISLLPAALGLCDNLHLFFNGLGLYLLSFIALSECKPLWSAVSLAALVAAASPTQVQSLMVTLASKPTQQRAQVAELAQVRQWEVNTGGQKVYAPAGLPLTAWTQLLADNRLQPDRFSGIDNAFSADAETIKREEMQQATFVLAPQGDLVPPAVDDRRRMRALRFWYRYKLVRPAFIPLKSLRAELLARGTPVGQADPYSGFQLYRLR